MDVVKKVAFVGDSQIAFWPLEYYFPQWECLNYGIPGAGIDYVDIFSRDTFDCEVVVLFGTNDLYLLTDDNMDAYVDRYINAVKAIPSIHTYLFSILPRNDYDDSVSINRFIKQLNRKIQKALHDANIIYIDVFGDLMRDSGLNEEYTVDGLHLNRQGYMILTKALNIIVNTSDNKV